MEARDPQAVAGARIARARRRGLRKLSLWGIGLEAVPPELAELQDLEELDLSHNRLQSLPAELGRLVRLERLGLGHNGLQALPAALGQLAALRELDLSFNPLREIPTELGRLGQLRQLNLAAGRLRQLPESLADLRRLRQLNLWGNRLRHLPQALTRLTELRRLSLPGNRLRGLPEDLAGWTELEELDLAHNLLAALPTRIEALGRLGRLDLSYNRLRRLPAGLGGLTHLQRLDLSYNHLRVLPPELGRLGELEWLSLAHNSLPTLPPELARLQRLKHLDLSFCRPGPEPGQRPAGWLPGELQHLQHLTYLNLSGNQLRQVPGELLRLPALTHLDLSGNELEALPTALAGMRSLREVNLSYNALRQLPPAVGELPRLEQLDLAHNLLRRLPSELTAAERLEQLNLAHNRIAKLPSGMDRLAHLRHLQLSFNRLTSLPPELGSLPSLQDLQVHGNPELGIPAELLGVGHPGMAPAVLSPPEIMTYHRRFREDTAAPLRQARILVVGEAGVRKTDLVRRLLGRPPEHRLPPTRGIERSPWQVRQDGEILDIEVWDFAGDRRLRFAHQMFYARRCLYLWVVDGGRPDAWAYWPRMIESFGPGAPVLVAVRGEVPPELTAEQLRRAYVRGVFELADRPDSLEALRRAVLGEVRRLEPASAVLPGTFHAVKAELEKRLGEAGYLDLGSYDALCQEFGIEAPRDRRFLLGLLHSLGTVLHFASRRVLRRYLFAPEWWIRGLYGVLMDEDLRRSRGVVGRSQLQRLLAEQGAGEDGALLLRWLEELLLSCHRREAPDNRWLPEHLPDAMPPGVELEPEPGSLAFQLRFEALPEGLLPRFIAHWADHWVEPPYLWRYGAVLAEGELRATVWGDRRKGRIGIVVRGGGPGCRAFLSRIRQTLRHLATDGSAGGIPTLQVREILYLPRDPDRTEDIHHLKTLLALGHKRYLPPMVRGPYDIQELLDGIEEPPIAASIEAPMPAAVPGEARSPRPPGGRQGSPWWRRILPLLVFAAALAVLGVWLVLR